MYTVISGYLLSKESSIDARIMRTLHRPSLYNNDKMDQLLRKFNIK